MRSLSSTEFLLGGNAARIVRPGAILHAVRTAGTISLSALSKMAVGPCYMPEVVCSLTPYPTWSCNRPAPDAHPLRGGRLCMLACPQHEDSRRGCRHECCQPRKPAEGVAAGGRALTVLTTTNIVSGFVIVRHYRRHRNSELLRFLKEIESPPWTCTWSWTATPFFARTPARGRPRTQDRWRYRLTVATNVFTPASSKKEAVARLYAVTGRPAEPLGPGSKEKKSSLIAVADRLDLAVHRTAPKDILARQLVEALGGRWSTRYSSTGQTVTLAGLNILLDLTETELRRRAAKEVRAESFALPDWFKPARDKLEAVRRISSLTGAGPQGLGPGSKERKSVLTNLVRDLDLRLDTRLPKTRLAGSIAATLGTPWDESCWSAGETITLNGLNAVLAGAEGRMLRGHAARQDRLRQEAQLLVAALAAACPPRWDGRDCVEQMRASEYRNWRQTEWVGWYFEFIGLPALIDAFGGGPVSIGSTEFDYQRDFIWDLKTHAQKDLTDPRDVAGRTPLNDKEAMELCVQERGTLGFLVLSGRPSFEELAEFDAWHRGLRGKPRSSSATPRRLKTALHPMTVEAYAFDGADSLRDAEEARALMLFSQGRQAGGSTRRPKYQMDLVKAREAGLVFARRPLG